eukprot:7914107-Pyramimonas_sp.AAC.1
MPMLHRSHENLHALTQRTPRFTVQLHIIQDPSTSSGAVSVLEAAVATQPDIAPAPQCIYQTVAIDLLPAACAIHRIGC